MRSRRTATSPTARFLPVRVLGGSAPSPEGPSFELELSRGIRVRVPPQFEEASLARLLRVVEAGT